MALVAFSSRATGPFIMFEETARGIFKLLGEPWVGEGAWAPEDLPGILAELDRLEALDKDRERQCRAEELKAEFENDDPVLKKEREERVHLYQRLVPLQDMIRRSIKKDVPVVWGKP